MNRGRHVPQDQIEQIALEWLMRWSASFHYMTPFLEKSGYFWKATTDPYGFTQITITKNPSKLPL